MKGCHIQTWANMLLQVISDLLKPENQNLVVREDRRRGVHVEGLSEWVVRNPSEVRGAAHIEWWSWFVVCVYGGEECTGLCS